LKTLAEIAIDAGLITKTSAAKAGKLAEERKQPLVVVMIRELGVDEVALVAALKKQMRIPIVDPGEIQVDPEALRQVPRDVCSRLRVLPLALTADLNGKVLRLAMADPTDTAAVAEIEQLAHCDIDVSALPLSAIEEMVDNGYKRISTVVTRPGGMITVTGKGKVTPVMEGESEVSVTAQLPIAALAMAGSDIEQRLAALVQVLVSKGVLTEDELAEALRKLTGDGGS
jgi:hypothetical protein